MVQAEYTEEPAQISLCFNFIDPDSTSCVIWPDAIEVAVIADILEARYLKLYALIETLHTLRYISR